MIANLLTSLLLSGYIGGSVCENTTTFNSRPPLNATTTLSYTETYTETLDYFQTDTEYKKFENKSTHYTSYAYIESYSYSFTTFNPYSSQVPSTLNNFRNITFYKINFYQQTNTAELDIHYHIKTNIVQGSATITADTTVYQYNDSQDINEYLDLSNFNSLYTYAPTNVETLLTSQDQTILNNGTANDITIDLGQFVNQNNSTQSYVVITDKKSITFSSNTIGAYRETLLTPNDLDVSLTTFSYDYQVIDIPSLMLTILTLPFSFISLAFGPITLFPNTPYQLNLGNMIMVIFTVLILLWIIQKVLKKG